MVESGNSNIIKNIENLKNQFKTEEEIDKIEKVKSVLNNINEGLKITYTNNKNTEGIIFFHNINEIENNLVNFLYNNITNIHIKSIEKL